MSDTDMAAARPANTPRGRDYQITSEGTRSFLSFVRRAVCGAAAFAAFVGAGRLFLDGLIAEGFWALVGATLLASAVLTANPRDLAP